MQTIDELIRDAPVFAGLPQEQLELIAGCGSNVTFEQDAVLFREAEEADTFYLVRHGSIALESYVPARPPMTIETLEAGEVVGWAWLFPPYRWHFDARALTEVRAIAFDGTCLRGKCDEDPALGHALMTRFAQVIVNRLQLTRLRLLDIYGNGSGR